jgi:inner membrane protein involved in colicin E2 resistance
MGGLPHLRDHEPDPATTNPRRQELVTKRIAGIVFIFVCTSVAWGILGATVFSRTYSSDAKPRGQVASAWGTPHQQGPPTASYQRVMIKTVESREDNRTVVRRVPQRITKPLPLEGSRVTVALDLEYRQKGLLWYSTYTAAFAGTYRFRNPTDREQMVSFTLNFPATQAIYDDLVITADSQSLELTHAQTAVSGSAPVPPRETTTLEVSYRSQGLDSWRYNFGSDLTQVRDFTLEMTTNFKDIDFPENTLSPTEKSETSDGWELTWRYKNLLSGFQIGMAMPQKLQPGPLAGRISFFAPVSLFFFFFLVFIITTLRSTELHPMNYFFLACAFFSFHLLLAYLADHISIHLAFAICSAVSIFLVVSYLRLVVGMRFAFVEAGIMQLIYLVLFSYTFFLEGYTGLAITIGSILTLFVVMQATARIRWMEKFAAKPDPQLR